MIIVFLPAYNEEIALPRVVSKIHEELKNLGEPYRIVVLDDGSRDRTAEVTRDLARRYPVELLQHPGNLGLGQTLKDGLEHAARIAKPDDWIVTLDCDDTHEPRYLKGALSKIREGYDLVILSRFTPGGGQEGLSPLKRLLSRGAGLFLKIFFPIKGVKEYSCGYRIFRAAALKKAFALFGDRFIRLPHMGFVVTAEILIKLRMMGCRITEVPFLLRYDQKTSPSKNRPFKTILGYGMLVFLYFGRRLSHESSHG